MQYETQKQLYTNEYPQRNKDLRYLFKAEYQKFKDKRQFSEIIIGYRKKSLGYLALET